MIPQSSFPVTFTPSPELLEFLEGFQPAPSVLEVTIKKSLESKCIAGIKRRMRGYTLPMPMEVQEDGKPSLGEMFISGVKVNGKVAWEAVS